MPENMPTIIAIVVAVVAVLAVVLSGYVKAPPDQAYIISGLKKESKVLIGRAGIRVPFLERMDRLYLGQMTVDIKTEQSVPTSDFINVNVDAVAKVRISPQAEGIKLAAKNFLNKRPEEITRDLQDSLQGNMREIIGTLSLKEINTDRDSFSDQVMQKASKDMDKLGIEILSCNIQNVTDENGLIKDLGADNTSLIKKNAAIAKAQADRDIAIAQAAAERLKTTQGNVLLTTGAKELGTFAPLGGERLYPRVLPLASSLEACASAGVPSSHILALQGPFSQELNEALIRQHHIAYLVTKDGGPAGGFGEKAAAAQAAGAKLLLIRRPQEEGLDYETVLQRCREMMECG